MTGNEKTDPVGNEIVAKLPSAGEYSITRPVLQTIELQNDSGYTRDESDFSLKEKIKSISIVSLLHTVIPITYWLPNYDLRNDLIGDMISGFTVAVMHIPQGMAYGILALGIPEVGLYMAFLPVLVYFALGTSRHASLGTFAIISIMVSKTVQSHANNGGGGGIATAFNSTIPDGTSPPPELMGSNSSGSFTSMEVITALSLAVGLIHIIMYVCRLGALSSLLSEPLVSGFTTGAAVHVFVNQIKDILGITVARHKGAFKIIYTVLDMISKVGESNVAAVIVSTVLILTMVLNNEYLKPWLAKKCRFPMPIELMAVIGGTLLSRLLDLGGNFHVALVGPIPTGLPLPQAPRLDLLPEIVMDAFAIAVVSYSVLMSMAKTFAKKHAYQINANQELLAMGLANFAGSFFSCMPTGCALARSVIQEQTGGKTQLASLVSAGLILLVILFIGPFFEVLPRCVLSSIIVVALKAMLWQVKNVKRFFRQDPLEALTWIVTFFAVVLIDIDLGLLCGVIMSLISLYVRGLKPYYCSLGVVPGTDIYVDLTRHEKAEKIADLSIFQYCGGINFTSSSGVKSRIYEASGLDEKVIMRMGKKQPGGNKDELLRLNGVRAIIFDMSCVPLLDFASCKSLLEIKSELKTVGVRFIIAAPMDRVYDVLMHAFLMERDQVDLFVSVHDAVLSVQNSNLEA